MSKERTSEATKVNRTIGTCKTKAAVLAPLDPAKASLHGSLSFVFVKNKQFSDSAQPFLSEFPDQTKKSEANQSVQKSSAGRHRPLGSRCTNQKSQRTYISKVFLWFSEVFLFFYHYLKAKLVPSRPQPIFSRTKVLRPAWSPVQRHVAC